MIKKIATGCAIFLLLFTGSALLYFFILNHYFDSDYNIHFSIMGAVSSLIFIGGLKHFLSGGMEEKTIRKCLRTSVFEDGEYVAVFGQIHPLGKPLISPLQKLKCVRYEYDIFKMVNSSSFDYHKESDFIGFARTPFAIQTISGDIEILGEMDLKYFATQNLNYSDIYENMQEYLARTKFEILQSDLLKNPPDLSQIVDELKKTERSDRRNPDSELERDHLITEICIEAGQEVCALGKYSKNANAIVSSSGTDAFINQLIPGNERKVLRLLQRKKYLRFFVTLVIFLLTHGFIYLMLPYSY
ncbi:MAG: hypothetical protein DWQ05_18055 [Calditrichaeota bacterium]|nr:MAG: hypothetical protein DWQ05_18055 [Calditrichota bacterium]